MNTKYNVQSTISPERNESLKKEKLGSHIFNKNLKNNYKLIPFNVRINAVGKTRYFPAPSKEWKNSIYSFNSNSIKNFPIYDLNINTLIKSYFNLYLFKKNQKKLKFIPRKFSLNKIHISKSEIKHTNSKAIITIYTFNKEKNSLLNKIKSLRQRKLRRQSNFRITHPITAKSTQANSFLHMQQLRKNRNTKIFFNENFFLLYKSKTLYKTSYNEILKSLLIKELFLIRRYKLKLNLNKYKFEEKFLNKLSKLISKVYKKKVEFNIVNLKSIILNSDLFTETLTLKIRKKKANVVNLMSYIINKARMPSVNRIQERSRIVKSIDWNLLENKYKNLNINFIVNKNNLDEILSDLYYKVNLENENSYSKLYSIVFNSIKYKNMGGIRLEVKGRLTKRYRADRAIFKVKWKGGLKNIDSSFRGLSSVKMRGYVNSNVESSIFTSKRRIGAFAVKGWASGK